jgi:hypothetical protein
MSSPPARWLRSRLSSFVFCQQRADPIDIGLLQLLRSTYEQDGKGLTVLHEVEAIAWSSINSKFTQPPPIHFTFDVLPNSSRSVAVATFAAACGFRSPNPDPNGFDRRPEYFLQRSP